MSLTLLRYRGQEIRAEDAAFVQRLITENPGWSRRRLSGELCRAWNWIQPNGALRDMVCRSLLLQLHRKQLIALPAKRFSPPNNVVARAAPAPSLRRWEQPRQCSLGQLGPLEIRQVRRTAQESLFGQLMQGHHYLRYTQPVGEHLKYLVCGPAIRRSLARSSAPASGRAGPIHRLARRGGQRRLHLIATTPAWPSCRGEGAISGQSVLGRWRAQDLQDWQQLYTHPIHLLKPSSIRRGPWDLLPGSQLVWDDHRPWSQRAGPSPRKELWVYPLSQDFRRHLNPRV
jgi:hypothetical protein